MAYLNKIVGQVIECVLTINIIFKNYLNPPFNGAVWSESIWFVILAHKDLST